MMDGGSPYMSFRLYVSLGLLPIVFTERCILYPDNGFRQRFHHQLL